MIKVAVKHFIYEHCVDVFFDKVTENFIRPKLKQFIQSKWTIDFSSDIMSGHGDSVYSQIIEKLTRECEKEIDAEIFKVMSQWNDMVKRTHNPVIITTFPNSVLPPIRKRY